jgi:hypothetical protein
MKKDKEDIVKEVVALISSRKHKHLDRLKSAFGVCLSLCFEAIEGKDGEYVEELDKYILRQLDGFKLVIES